MSVSRLTLPVVWQLETQRTSTDKASITTKVKPSIEMSCWILHVQGTKLWLMVVHILVLARLSDLGPGDALHTSDRLTTAHQL